jgi:putative peptidoglycan lipid II flippase
MFHLGIQIPGLLRFGFRWTASLRPTPEFWRVLLLLLPRLISMVCVQLIFLVRDNLASRLDAGSVSALTYGWMIFQLPETLIGTAVGVAILPTLAELFSQGQEQAFRDAVQRAVQVLLAVTLPIAAVFGLALRPLLVLAFQLDAAGADVLLWVSRMYLLGLAGQCLMEVASRSFYARQMPWPAMGGALFNLALFSLTGVLLFRPLGAPGIALADAIAYSMQALLLLVVLGRQMGQALRVGETLLRSLLATGLGATVVLLVAELGKAAPLPAALAGMALGGTLAFVLVWKDFRLILRM